MPNDMPRPSSLQAASPAQGLGRMLGGAADMMGLPSNPRVDTIEAMQAEAYPGSTSIGNIGGALSLMGKASSFQGVPAPAPQPVVRPPAMPANAPSPFGQLPPLSKASVEALKKAGAPAEMIKGVQSGRITPELIEEAVSLGINRLPGKGFIDVLRLIWKTSGK
jgi:hypothetical protein